MTTFTLPTPKTAKEFDQLCEAYRASLAETFDFSISDKKRNKLRDAVSRMLGYPNGYQQIKTRSTDIASHVLPPAVDLATWFADQPERLEKLSALCAEQCTDRIVLRFCDELFFDYEFIGLCSIPGDAFKVNRYNEILNYDFEREVDLSSLANDEDITALLDYLRANYLVEGFHVSIPDVSKYGVPDNANVKLALAHVKEELAFSVVSDEAFLRKHVVDETHDDSSGMVCLMLSRRSMLG